MTYSYKIELNESEKVIFDDNMIDYILRTLGVFEVFSVTHVKCMLMKFKKKGEIFVAFSTYMFDQSTLDDVMSGTGIKISIILDANTTRHL